MAFNPLSVILKENKLTGPNYIDWKRNLDIVLTAEGYKYVLTEVCPDKPREGSGEEEGGAYSKWVKADEMARCYILASMSNVLQHQHQSMATAYDMMLNLKELFGHQSRAARQEAMRKLMTTKMAEGTPVRDHALNMMALLNEIEVQGGEIDGETQVDIVLQSLPRSFEQFRLNYNMNKRLYTLAELLAELQAAEGLFRQGAQALVAVTASGSSYKPKGKRKKKKQTGPASKIGASGTPSAASKPKGKCFRCKQTGHWKKDCPRAKEKGISHSLVTETCLAVLSTGTWCVDTGATDHVCNSLQGFQETRKLRDGEITVYMGNATKVAAVAVGDVCLFFPNNRRLVLKDCLFVPFFRKNLISVSKLVMNGYGIAFTNNVVISMDGQFICSGTMENSLYILKPITPTMQHMEINNTSSNHNKRKAPSSMNQTYLWHLRLGHINLNRIQRLIADGPLGSLEVENYPTCESCLEGKMTKRPFKAKGYRAKDVLELVHSDLCGPMTIQARGGYEYFVTFIDDYSRYGYIYLMRRKSECFGKFKEFKAEVENRQGKSIKSLRSDRGGEYLSGEFRSYLSEVGIQSQLTAPGTPQQNGVA
ncbi:DDE-type integrase/transposase/recombinase, partial [Clostridioides difficile]|nr:DDE-type integrase/transposase/recombinase [Clostridioides difficile]